MSNGRVVELVPRRDKSTAPATADGLRQVLEALDIEVRFNQRLWQVEHRCSDGVWERFTPRSEARLKERIAEDFDQAPNGPRAKGRLMFTGRRWDQALNALVAEREVDPVVEWLEQLPPWDGMPRLDSWIGLCFRVDSGTPAALCAWAARSILLGAVWRAYRPGTKHDVLVVFVGPQGIGKSTSFAWLFPPSDRDAWFSDTLTLNGSGKERVEALQGRVLVECAEMAGSTQGDRARLKGFLSRTDDGGIRLAYRRNPEPRPRRAVLVGSTNDFRCLPNDASGNRRFLPIAITAGDVKHVRSWLDECRQQLWAEALHRYHAGETAFLPDELAAAQAAASERHREADDLVENAIDAWMGQADPPEFVKVEDAACQAGLVDQHRRVSRELAGRIRAALKLRGYVAARTRLDGAKYPVRCYRRP